MLGKGMERNKAFLLLRDSLFCRRLVENIVHAPGSERKEGRQLGRENITCRQLCPGRKRCGVEGVGGGGRTYCALQILRAVAAAEPGSEAALTVLHSRLHSRLPLTTLPL